MDEKICVKCNFMTTEDVPNCPQCRTGKLQSRSTLRVLGGVLIALGLVLIGIMSVVAIFVVGAMAGNGKGNTRFTGSETDMMFMVSVIGVVFMFGVATLVAGLWHLIFGRRNKFLIWIMFGLGALFFIAGQMVEFMD